MNPGSEDFVSNFTNLLARLDLRKASIEDLLLCQAISQQHYRHY
jgi:hypothetical protein